MNFNAETAKAVISAAVVLIVDIASMFGYSLDTNAVTNAIFVILMIVATCYGVWKNHNFTRAAQDAQRYLHDIKLADSKKKAEQNDGQND